MRPRAPLKQVIRSGIPKVCGLKNAEHLNGQRARTPEPIPWCWWPVGDWLIALLCLDSLSEQRVPCLFLFVLVRFSITLWHVDLHIVVHHPRWGLQRRHTVLKPVVTATLAAMLAQRIVNYNPVNGRWEAEFRLLEQDAIRINYNLRNILMEFDMS